MTICVDKAIIGPWVAQKTGGTWCGCRGEAIGRLSASGEIIAGVLYEDFNGVNMTCHIAGEKNWATKKFLSVIFHYPFIHVGVSRITAPVCSSNKKSRNLVEKLGFRVECSLAQATPAGDLLLYVMHRDSCKYIKPPFYFGL